jgi:hypothetical protein
VPPPRSIALALALLAVGAQPALGEGHSVTVKKRLGQGVSTFAGSCPRNYVALNGASFPTPGDVVPSYSGPGESLRRWRFGFDAGGPGTVRTTVRCGRTRFPRRVHVKFQVQSVARNDIRLGAGTTKKVALRCTEGHVPTGYGQDQSPGGATSPRDPGAIDFQSVVPHKHGITFGLRNDTSEAAKVNVFMRCWQRKIRGRTSPVEPRSFRDKVRAGKGKRVKHSCRRGEFALATGWSIPRGSQVSLSSSRPDGSRRGRWAFDNDGGASNVRTSLLCLSGR